MKDKKGFTLLELLVVVLIIGILAAIALPQYRKAVEKSKVAEALVNIKNIEDSINRLLLAETVDEINSLEQLDIEFPEVENGVYVSQNFTYGILGSGFWDSTGFWEAEAYRNNDSYSLNLIISLENDNEIKSSHDCFTNNTDIGRYICRYLESQNWKYNDRLPNEI